MYRRIVKLTVLIPAIVLSFFIFYILDVQIKERLYSLYSYFSYEDSYLNAITVQQTVNKVEKNYGAEVELYAEEFGLSPEYLKALIALECSGHKPAPSRFEPHVYEKLLDLYNGKIRSYGSIKQSDIFNATDDAIRNLASSWGPFQLMGYKCIQLGINVGEMRGENAVYWGIKWIDMTYGSYLRNFDFENAFHIHNTGKEYPVDGNATTSHPDYVSRGILYMKYFE